MGITPHIELRQLRAFVAVGEELNFRRAAERLHVSQPPLSRTIAQFEAEVGGRLLERNRRHCALTPLGRQVLDQARALIAQVDGAAADWRRRALRAVPPADPAPLRLGLFFAMTPQHFPELQRLLHERLGADVSVALEVARTHELLPRLRRGLLDAAVVMLPAELGGLDAVPVVHTEMVALLPASHALARRRTLAVADLAQLPRFLFVGRRQNAPLYRHLDAALRARGLALRNDRVVRDTYGGLAEVAAGLAAAVVCRTMADAGRADVAFRPLRAADRLPIDLALVVRPGLAAATCTALEAALRVYLAPYELSRRTGA